MIMIGKIHYTVNNERRTITRALKINDKSSIKKTSETMEKALKICARLDCENQKTTIQYCEYDIIREIDPILVNFWRLKHVKIKQRIKQTHSQTIGIIYRQLRQNSKYPFN